MLKHACGTVRGHVRFEDKNWMKLVNAMATKLLSKANLNGDVPVDAYASQTKDVAGGDYLGRLLFRATIAA